MDKTMRNQTQQKKLLSPKAGYAGNNCHNYPSLESCLSRSCRLNTFSLGAGSIFAGIPFREGIPVPCVSGFIIRLAQGPYGMKATFECGAVPDFTAFKTTEPKSVVTLMLVFSFTPRAFMSPGSIKQITTLSKYSWESLPISFPLP